VIISSAETDRDTAASNGRTANAVAEGPAVVFGQVVGAEELVEKRKRPGKRIMMTVPNAMRPNIMPSSR
jgi:hypothetical protein